MALLEAVLEDWELRRALHAATLALGLRALGASVTAADGGSLGAVATVATIFGSEGPATTALLGWDDLRDHLERLLVIRKPSDADMALEMPEVRPVVPVQIEKLRIFRTIFWVSLREN